MAVESKKRVARTAPESRRPVPGASWVDHIEQMGDLGQGYVLVKLNTKGVDAGADYRPARARASALADAAMPASVKRFTPRQLDKLIRSFSAGGGAAQSAAMARALPPAPQPPRMSGPNAQFMSDMRAQEMANRQRDFDDGLLLTSGALAERLQVSTQALGKAVRARRMFTLDGPSGRSVFPAFFADPRCNRVHIEQVCQALGSWPGPRKWEFFTSPRTSLNGLTPIEALARGELDQVLRAAGAFRDR